MHERKYPILSQKNEEKEQSVSLKISMPDSLRVQFKAACALQKVTMNKAVLILIKEWLKGSECDSQPKKSVDFLG